MGEHVGHASPAGRTRPSTSCCCSMWPACGRARDHGDGRRHGHPAAPPRPGLGPAARAPAALLPPRGQLGGPHRLRHPRLRVRAARHEPGRLRARGRVGAGRSGPLRRVALLAEGVLWPAERRLQAAVARSGDAAGGPGSAGTRATRCHVMAGPPASRSCAARGRDRAHGRPALNGTGGPRAGSRSVRCSSGRVRSAGRQGSSAAALPAAADRRPAASALPPPPLPPQPPPPAAAAYRRRRPPPPPPQPSLDAGGGGGRLVVGVARVGARDRHGARDLVHGEMVHEAAPAEFVVPVQLWAVLPVPSVRTTGWPLSGVPLLVSVEVRRQRLTRGGRGRRPCT